MEELLLALGGVMGGVVLDQVITVVRDARRHRRERDHAHQETLDLRFRDLERKLGRVENNQASTLGLLRGVIAGRVEISDLVIEEDEEGD